MVSDASTTLSRSRYLEVLQAETERLAEIAASTDLRRQVPACPDWTLSDLAYHVGEVHRFWTWVANERITEMTDGVERPPIEDPADEDLPEWLRTGLADLVDAIAEVEPDTPVWSWSPQHNMGFIQRRMPHETSVHRWDAEATIGNAAATLAPDLAADGVSEFLFLATAEQYDTADPRVAPRVAPRLAPRLALRASDTGHSWGAGVRTDGTFTWQLGREDAQTRVEGTAHHLLMLLWRREHVSDGHVEVQGQRSDVEQFLALPDLT